MVSIQSIRRRRRIIPIFAAALLILLIIIPVATSRRSPQDQKHLPEPPKGAHEPKNEGGYGNQSGEVVEPNRVWGDKCSASDLLLVQGPTGPMDTGIPTYTVEIVNLCVTGCNISGIHLSCAWFSSARLINPRIFRRLRFDDCLVNDGKPLLYGHSVSFQYANTFSYPLSVTTVNC